MHSPVSVPALLPVYDCFHYFNLVSLFRKPSEIIFVCFSVLWSFGPSVHLSFCLFVHLPVCSSGCLAFWPSIHMFLFPSVPQSVCFFFPQVLSLFLFLSCLHLFPIPVFRCPRPTAYLIISNLFIV